MRTVRILAPVDSRHCRQEGSAGHKAANLHLLTRPYCAWPVLKANHIPGCVSRCAFESPAVLTKHVPFGSARLYRPRGWKRKSDACEGSSLCMASCASCMALACRCSTRGYCNKSAYMDRSFVSFAGRSYLLWCLKPRAMCGQSQLRVLLLVLLVAHAEGRVERSALIPGSFSIPEAGREEQKIDTCVQTSWRRLFFAMPEALWTRTGGESSS